MKILHSESSLGWGGQERRILLDMEAMRTRGCEVHLVCDPQSIIAARAAEKQFYVHTMPLRRWFNPWTLVRLIRLLSQEKFDLIHTHSSGDSWALGVAAHCLGHARPRLVRTRHLSTPIGNAFVYTRLADRIITTGQGIRALLIRAGVKEERVISIPTGVDADIFNPDIVDGAAFRNEIGVEASTTLIGNVAVLRSWKGHDDFLAAAKKIHEQCPKTQFILVGDGPQKERLEQRVQQEGMSGFVRLLGHRQDIPSVLAGLDIFLFTSYANEGVPQAIAQAMAMGKSVLSTRFGGSEELIVDGQRGILVPPRDVEEMAGRVMSLIHDRTMAGRLAQAGKEFVLAHYSLAYMEDAMVRLYNELCEDKQIPLLCKEGIGEVAALKIALIRQKVSPHGGAESVVHRLAAEFSKRGHAVHVVAADWESELPGVTYHRIAIPRKGSMRRALSFQRGVKNFLQGNSFDIVHGFDKTFPVDVYRAGDGSHCAWLRHSARPLSWLQPKNWILLWLEKQLLKDPMFKIVIANSDLVRQELLQFHDLQPSKVVTIRNGIDVASCHPPETREERARAKRALGLAESDTVLLFIGSNYHRKGLAHALEALAANHRAGLVLLVVGKGKEKRYRQIAARAGIEKNIRFLGEIKDTSPLYRAADLLLLPTLYDPFSNVCLEAMAHGMSVLTTPTNGASEIVEDGKTGWVAAPQETAIALAEALRADLWELGRSALAAVQAHSFLRMADQILEVYAGCLKGRSRR